MNGARAIAVGLLAFAVSAWPACAQQGQAEMEAVRSTLERAREAAGTGFDPGVIRNEDREALKSLAGADNPVVRGLGAAAHAAPAPPAATPVERPASNERATADEPPPPVEPAGDPGGDDQPAALLDDPQTPDIDAGVTKRGDRDKLAKKSAADPASPEKDEPSPSAPGSMPRVVHVPAGRASRQGHGAPIETAGRTVPTLGGGPAASSRPTGGFEEIRVQPRAAAAAEPARNGGFGAPERAASQPARR